MVLGLLLAPLVEAQVVRPPELHRQYHRAETAWRTGSSMLEAKARVDRVLNALPQDADARKLRAEVLLAMDRPADAFVDAQVAVDLQPHDPEALILLCEAARRTDRLDIAAAALDQAADQVSDDATMHVRLSWNAAALGSFDKAEAFARIALAADPNHPACYYQLARAFIQQDDLEEAALTLAQGFERSLLDAGVIERDGLLARVAAHEALENFMEP